MSDELDVEGILGPDGRIASRIKAYEHRSQQLTMANAITEALENRKHLVVEAGTGVGKSFAYLVPAILFATQAESKLAKSQKSAAHSPDSPSDTEDDDDEKKTRRIVVSTHTISLQEQLISKDLPLLNAVIPREFSSVLVKGRGNYISLRRLELARQRATNLLASDTEHDQLQQIVSWSKTTSDGSRSDYRFRHSVRFGMKLPAIPAIAWDENASHSTSVTTIALDEGFQMHKYSWSITLCSLPTWRCASRTPRFFPTTMR